MLNAQKLKFREREVPYVGHVLTGSGLQASPDKVRAICNMPRPGNMGDVRRFVGMANYLARFLPALSGTLEPLHQLTNKDIAWQWNEEQEQAFCKVKEALTVAPVLRFFDKDIHPTVQCDASQTGLGAVLLQQDQPIWQKVPSSPVTRNRLNKTFRQICLRLHQL